MAHSVRVISFEIKVTLVGCLQIDIKRYSKWMMNGHRALSKYFGNGQLEVFGLTSTSEKMVDRDFKVHTALAYHSCGASWSIPN